MLLLTAEMLREESSALCPLQILSQLCQLANFEKLTQNVGILFQSELNSGEYPVYVRTKARFKGNGEEAYMTFIEIYMITANEK